MLKRTDDVNFSLSAYRRMSLIRGIERLCLEFSTGDSPVAVGSIHLCAGQEAIPVGTVEALHSDDQISATYRGHGWALESGIPAFEVLSEIAHKATGINGGRAGSAMMIAPEHRFIGENSIVGAGYPIAAGVALAQKLQGTGGISVVSIGDGAMNQGAVHEAMAFAALNKLPVLFICENNGWAEMTRADAVAPVPRQAQRARAYGIRSATVDGNDPIAVRDSVASARSHILDNDVPVFLEFTTARLWGHYNKDIQHYRPRSDAKDAEARDPIAALRARILNEGMIAEGDLDRIDDDVEAELEQLRTSVVTAPNPDPATARDHVIGTAPSDFLVSTQEREPSETTYGKAIAAALQTELAARSEMLVYGEDVGVGGGIFGCTRNLQKEFGATRVFDTPISESAILGSALGAAMMGMRPVVEIMWADFMLVALDQIINQMANLRYITRGTSIAPLVVRMQQGVTPGSCAQHSQSLEALLFHTPGLRIGLPSTAQDAHDMLRAAIACDDPTIIIESRAFYQRKEEVDFATPVQPIGGLRTRRAGNDIALVSWSTGMPVIERAAELLADSGVEAAVIDLRWLSPLPESELIEAIGKAGNAAFVMHEANQTGGVGAELLCRLRDAGIENVGRLGTPDMRMPASPVLQQEILPNAEAVAARVMAQLGKV
ncbi:thiamine pyrophosphate-dependent enzyme [Thalassovita sp.]|uniref:alpha-ketoacid dehydrogenase subunit alpha/beta n=1 Tax=Thalassovita sp. TaxID=1979401 RepID=UPI0029DE701C|nr:thiamine pyrophosphate-dependent enzyme [Thalassovita sp.]